MATFKFGVRVPTPALAVEPAALGVDASNKLNKNDIGKAVKLAANNNYVLVSNGDGLEAVVLTIEANTVNNGFSFGSVQKRFDHLEAEVVGTTVAVGDRIVCAAQAALGTAHSTGCPRVRVAASPADDTASANFPWRVKSLLSGNGSAGTIVLIEPLGRS